jgi:hypothetical protein
VSSYPVGPQHHPTAPDDAWADTLVVACPHCHALEDIRCHNTITGHVMKAPHYHRIQAAEKTAS